MGRSWSTSAVTSITCGSALNIRQLRLPRRSRSAAKAGQSRFAATARRATLQSPIAIATATFSPAQLSYKEQLELDGLPGRIAGLEREQAQLREEAAAPAFYKSPAARIAEVLARIESVAHDLEALLARWVELEDIRKVR